MNYVDLSAKGAKCLNVPKRVHAKYFPGVRRGICHHVEYFYVPGTFIIRAYPNRLAALGFTVSMFFLWPWFGLKTFVEEWVPECIALWHPYKRGIVQEHRISEKHWQAAQPFMREVTW